MIGAINPGATQPITTPAQPGGPAEQLGTAEQKPEDNAPQPTNAALAQSQDSEQDTKPDTQSFAGDKGSDTDDTKPSEGASKTNQIAAEDEAFKIETLAAKDNNHFDPTRPRGSIIDLNI